ncbi:MAG: hypothetical protein K1Y02_13395 [Candidatus Hydrogenedentes bacterium]|nr:hypothetical protein [Candidatus Hydrogenedentota bacterium]
MFPTMCKIVMTTLLIGVWLLGASPVAHGLVLCFERDGRVQLEMAYRGVCAETSTSRVSSSPSSAMILQVENGAHCDTCVDVPVISAAGKDQQFIVPASSVHHQPLANDGATIPLPILAYTSIIGQTDALPTPQSVTLRSTVLLI